MTQPFSTEDVKRVSYNYDLECYVGYFADDYTVETEEDGEVEVAGIKMKPTQEIVTKEQLRE